MFYENEYQEYLHATGRRPTTCRVHHYSLRRLIEFLKTRGIGGPKTVTPDHLEAFALELAARDYDVETRANHMMRIRIYFGFLEKQKLIFISPAAGLRMPRGKGGHHQAYTDQELTELISKLDVTTPMGLRARAILELAYSAALRPREIRALKLGDIDRAKGVIFIEQSKNLKDRIVPVGHGALDWVDRYIAEVREPSCPRTDHLFVRHTDGGPLSDRGLTWAIAEACRQAGIKTIRLYSMRRSAATNLLEGGMGAIHISRLLGHASITTTQIYLQTRQRDLARILEANHPRFREGASA
jgi:integrase/recombinase XerD